MSYSKRWDSIQTSRDQRDVAFQKEIRSLSKEGKDSFISLTIGDPVLYGLVNESVVAALNAAIKKKLFMYPEVSGVQEEFRRAVSKFELENRGMDYDPSNILITSGVAGAFNVLHYALLDPGDEVVAFSPSHYAATTTYLSSLRAKVVQVPSAESENWVPNSEDLRKAISPNTKMIVVNSPANPTGAVYPEKTLQQIADIASESGIPIVSDEIYSPITFDGVTAHPTGRFSKDNLFFTVSGVSKIFCAPGMRVGYICMKTDNEDKFGRVVDAVRRVALTYGHASSGVPTPMIAAAAELYKSDLRDFEDILKKLEERRTFVVKRIKEMTGISLVPPSGALYFFPKIEQENGRDEYSFLLELAKEEGVSFSPGTPFGMGGASHFRGVFAADIPVLSEAMDRLERFLRKKKKS